MDLIVNIEDINYEITIKNKIEKRKERIIFFGTEQKFQYLNKEKCNEYFADISFQIIPKKFRPYKLLIISGLPIQNKKPISICFILL